MARVADVLSRIACPLVEVAADMPPDAIARLMAFAGLDAVLLVRPCGLPERIVCARELVGALAGRAPEPPVSGPPRCRPGDALACAARAMFRHDQEAVLVEQDGRRLAIITIDSLAGYLASRPGAPR